MIPDKYFDYILSFVIIISAFNVFELTVYNQYPKYIILALSFFGYFLLFTKHKIFPRLIKIPILLITLQGVLLVILSFIRLEQTPQYSFAVAHRFFTVGVFALISYRLMRNKKFYLRFIKMLIILSVINIFLLTLMLFFNPDFSFVTKKNSLFLNYLIIFSGIYSFNKGVKNNNYFYIIFGIFAFSVFHVYDIQRFILIANLLTFLVYFLLFLKNKRIRIGISLVLILLIAITLIDNPLNQMVTEKFESFNRLLVTQSSDKIEESSILIRITQLEYAIPEILKHPILGHGFVGGDEKWSIIGENYFFIADIGIFGILYSAGLFGVIIFSFISSIGIHKKKIKFYNESDTTVFFFLIFLIIVSVGNTVIFTNPALFMLFITLIVSRNIAFDQKLDHI